MKKTVDIADIATVGIESSTLETDKVLDRLNKLRRDYQASRSILENYWKEYYTAYMTTPQAAAALSGKSAKKYMGDVNTQWRHKLKTPKAYETVETIVSWLMSAFFPNEVWFDLKTSIPYYDPAIHDQLRVIKMFMQQGLTKAHVKRKFRIFLRELAITGTAAIAFPLVSDNLKLDVMPSHTFWLDPESQDPNDANMIRTYTVAKAQLLKLIKDEYFNVAEAKDFEKGNNLLTNYSAIQEHVQQNLRAITNTQNLNYTDDYVICYEYWGNLILDEGMLFNVRATFTDNRLLGIETNPFERRPFVVGNYTQLGNSPYGIGAIQPIMAQLVYRDVLTSRHADNVAVGSDTMLEVVEGGVIDMDRVVVKPGQVIPVTKPGSVNPVVMPTTNLSLQEIGVLDQTVDKATGTGPYIGVNAGRSGERVTAAEIDAQRAAGGNRLTDIYADVETTVLLPMLDGYYYYLKNFGTAIQAVVRSNEDEYFAVDGSIFSPEVDFYVLGANNVADKEYKTRQLMEFLNIVSSNDQLAQRTNWDTVAGVIAQTFLPAMAEQLVQPVPPPPTPEGAPAVDPAMAELQQAAQFSGGQPAVTGIEAAQQAGQLDQMAQQMQSNLM